MASGTTDITIDRAPAEVWEIVRDFARLGSWMPGIDSCEIDGDDRILGMFGISVRERLIARDDDKRRLTYCIVESPMNLEHHEATITVNESNGGSHVTYDVDVEPATMLDVLVQTYRQALGALKQRAES
jgi:Polyketide cyclase / dehydrase and lipid transport